MPEEAAVRDEPRMGATATKSSNSSSSAGVMEFPVAASEWSTIEYETSCVQIYESEWRDYVVYYAASAGAKFEPPLFLRALSRGI